MARDYDHLFKLLIIGDSGKKSDDTFEKRITPPCLKSQVVKFKNFSDTKFKLLIRNDQV